MDMIGKLELVREFYVAVVKEMRANIIHSSYSSIIYEGHDFSCALMAADGRLVAQSLDDNPIHIFPVPFLLEKSSTISKMTSIQAISSCTMIHIPEVRISTMY